MLENLDAHTPIQLHPQLTQMQQKSPERWSSRPPPPTSSVVSDDIRFAIIDAVYLRPGIWDTTRDKNGHSRKALFAEITQLLNTQNPSVEAMTCEEVEKQWKNLKDTFNKTRKKITYDNEGNLIPPKWKFFSSMMFLDEIQMTQTPGPSRLQLRGRSEESGGPPMKRGRDGDEEEDDEYMGFCKSLVYPLREIGYRDKIQFLKLQKTIRDLVYEAQLQGLEMIPAPQQHAMRNEYK